MTVYIAIPLIAITLWVNVRGPMFFKQGLIIYGVALMITLPWFIRNMRLYGGFDLLGLARHDEIVAGQLRTADFLAEVGPAAYLRNFVSTTFQSFWGQFGWMAAPMDNRTYLLLAILTLAVLGGLGAWLATTQLSGGQHRSLTLLALVVLLVSLGYGWYNLTFVQFQGRYLFPGLIPLGLFFAIGLHEVLNRRWAGWLIGGLALGLIGVIIFSSLNGGLDKWVTLIIGLALLGAIGRLWLPRTRTVGTMWLLLVCYAGLGLLTLLSPFWFVLPYL
jgi:hypothetical protein